MVHTRKTVIAYTLLTSLSGISAALVLALSLTDSLNMKKDSNAEYAVNSIGFSAAGLMFGMMLHLATQPGYAACRLLKELVLLLTLAALGAAIWNTVESSDASVTEIGPFSTNTSVTLFSSTNTTSSGFSIRDRSEAVDALALVAGTLVGQIAGRVIDRTTSLTRAEALAQTQGDDESRLLQGPGSMYATP